MTHQDSFRFKWWGLLGICLLAFTAFLDATIVNTALPFIQTALNANILQLQWVANIFTLLLSMTMIAMGKFADLWGKKKVFYSGVLLFALAAFGAGLSSNVQMLILFRGLQALGASTIFTVSAALLSDVFPKNERIRAISIYGGVTGCGLMIGPFLGGILISLLDWRWIFWINLPLIAIGLNLCSFSLRGLCQAKSLIHLDWLGLFLLVFGLGALMYGIISAAENDRISLVTGIVIGTGAIMLILLGFVAKLRKNSLLTLDIFKEKLIVLAVLSCALAGVVSTVFMFFDPLYLHTLRNLSPFLIGLLIAAIPAAQAFICFVFNLSVKLFGVASLLCFSVISAFFAVVLHRIIQIETPVLFFLFPFFLLGVNWGLSNVAMITAVNQVVAPDKIGGAIGTIATIWNLAGSIFLSTSTAIFYSAEIRSSFLPAFYKTINFNIAFAAILSIAAIWVHIGLKKNNTI